MTRDFGYHIENEGFVGALEAHAAGQGIALIDGKIELVHRTDDGVTGVALASGTALRADLYIDCTGFASLLLGRTLHEKFRSFFRFFTAAS